MTLRGARATGAGAGLRLRNSGLYRGWRGERRAQEHDHLRVQGPLVVGRRSDERGVQVGREADHEGHGVGALLRRAGHAAKGT